MAKARKKEKWYHRWRAKHKNVQLWLRLEDYALLDKLASQYNMTVKDFLLSVVKGLKVDFSKLKAEAVERAKEILKREVVPKAREEGWREGVRGGRLEAVENFVRKPEGFYKDVLKFAEALGVEAPFIFQVKCRVCGEPIVMSHAHPESFKIKERLREAFKDITHKECAEKQQSSYSPSYSYDICDKYGHLILECKTGGRVL